MISMIDWRKKTGNWYRRRWLDFRNGHSIYLVFLMTFANFIAIQYNLMIERLPIFDPIFGSLWLFALIFIAIYIPLAMIIGYWHRKNQWKVETEAMFRENEIGARIWLFVINLIDGKATEQEKEEIRQMLAKISKNNVATNTSNRVEIPTSRGDVQGNQDIVLDLTSPKRNATNGNKDNPLS